MRIQDLRQRLASLGALPKHQHRVLRLWSNALPQTAGKRQIEHFLPATLRAALPALEADLAGLAQLESAHPGDDGSERLLVKLGDGQLVESVLLLPDRTPGLCVSTQVGCAVGCVFCMTGKSGLLRQLSTAEIVAQVALARRYRPGKKVVFMGMGEPAHNLDNVLEAINLLGTEGGIGQRNLVFSTVGDPRVFERLPQQQIKPALALSLHSTDAEPSVSMAEARRVAGRNIRFAVQHKVRFAFGTEHQRTPTAMAEQLAFVEALAAPHGLVLGERVWRIAVEHADELHRFIETEQLLGDLVRQVSPEAAAARTGVTEATIRQDLEKLESDGYVTREHGGAYLKSVPQQVKSMSLQHGQNMDRKQRIGIAAVQLHLACEAAEHRRLHLDRAQDARQRVAAVEAEQFAFRRVAAQQDLRVAQDAVERRAQLVAGVGQEGALRAAGSLGVVAGARLTRSLNSA